MMTLLLGRGINLTGQLGTSPIKTSNANIQHHTLKLRQGKQRIIYLCPYSLMNELPKYHHIFTSKKLIQAACLTQLRTCEESRNIMVGIINKGFIRLHARPTKELTSPIVQMRKEKIGFCKFSFNKKCRKLKTEDANAMVIGSRLVSLFVCAREAFGLRFENRCCVEFGGGGLMGKG